MTRRRDDATRKNYHVTRDDARASPTTPRAEQRGGSEASCEARRAFSLARVRCGRSVAARRAGARAFVRFRRRQCEHPIRGVTLWQETSTRLTTMTRNSRREGHQRETRARRPASSRWRQRRRLDPRRSRPRRWPVVGDAGREKTRGGGDVGGAPRGTYYSEKRRVMTMMRRTMPTPPRTPSRRRRRPTPRRRPPRSNLLSPTTSAASASRSATRSTAASPRRRGISPSSSRARSRRRRASSTP